MSKHLSDEELNHDVLIDASAKSIEYINNNKNTIIGAIVAVVVIIGSGLGYNYWSQKNEIKAQTLLAKAELLFENKAYDEALNGDDINFVMGFEELYSTYGSTKAGNLAAYYSAVCAYELGEYENSKNFIEAFDTPDGILGVSPLNLHASILEQVGDSEAAAEMYLKAAEWVENETTTPFNLLEAAEAYKTVENTSKATALLERIVKDYAQSQQATTAKQMLGMMKG